MEIKRKVLEFRKNGMSFGQIAKTLGIGKTTAFNYYKEMATVPKPQIPAVRNANERVMNDNSERSELKKPQIIRTPTNPINPSETVKSTLKELTADELVRMEFDCLEFSGKFLELIGKPSRIFSGIIWGLPKGGKSNLTVRFADYLQEYFGDVAYFAAEEGHSSSLKEIFQRINGGRVTVVECRKRDEIRDYIKSRSFQFIFIDSINVAGIDSEFFECLKTENPKKSFIAVVQATKSGNFKGDQSLTHNCDFVIKVIEGVAYHHGRFGPASEIKIFEGELYVKNSERLTNKSLEAEALNESKESQPLITPVSHDDQSLVTPNKRQDFNLTPILKDIRPVLGITTAPATVLPKPARLKRPITNKKQLNVLKFTAGVMILSGLLNYLSEQQDKATPQ